MITRYEVAMTSSHYGCRYNPDRISEKRHQPAVMQLVIAKWAIVAFLVIRYVGIEKGAVLLVELRIINRAR
jgi:hypothetical protein